MCGRYGFSIKNKKEFYTRFSVEYFSFAGIYDLWRDPKTQKEIKSYSIITCPANGLVSKIHPRMPVILKKENEEKWVDQSLTDPKDLFALLVTRPVEEMECYRVSRDVSNVRIDDETLIKPVTGEEQTSLF